MINIQTQITKKKKKINPDNIPKKMLKNNKYLPCVPKQLKKRHENI